MRPCTLCIFMHASTRAERPLADYRRLSPRATSARPADLKQLYTFCGIRQVGAVSAIRITKLALTTGDTSWAADRGSLSWARRPVPWAQETLGRLMRRVRRPSPNEWFAHGY